MKKKGSKFWSIKLQIDQEVEEKIRKMIHFLDKKLKKSTFFIRILKRGSSENQKKGKLEEIFYYKTFYEFRGVKMNKIVKEVEKCNLVRFVDGSISRDAIPRNMMSSVLYKALHWTMDKKEKKKKKDALLKIIFEGEKELPCDPCLFYDPNQTTNLSDIPNEVMIEIINYLDITDLANTFLSCEWINSCFTEICWKLLCGTHSIQRSGLLTWKDSMIRLFSHGQFLEWKGRETDRGTYHRSVSWTTLKIDNSGTVHFSEHTSVDHAWSDDGVEESKEWKLELGKGERFRRLKQIVKYDYVLELANNADEEDNVMPTIVYGIKYKQLQKDPLFRTIMDYREKKDLKFALLQAQVLTPSPKDSPSEEEGGGGGGILYRVTIKDISGSISNVVDGISAFNLKEKFQLHKARKKEFTRSSTEDGVWVLQERIEKRKIIGVNVLVKCGALKKKVLRANDVIIDFRKYFVTLLLKLA